MRLLVPVLASLLALAACHGRTDPPGEAPTNVQATPGDGVAVITWDMLPDLTYWIFLEPGSSVAIAKPDSIALRRAISPRVVAGLANDTQYAFAMNATHNDSAAGPASPVVTAIPKLAGPNWVTGSVAGTTASLRDLAFNGSVFVAIGDATTAAGVTSPTIFAGAFSYTSGQFNAAPGDPQGVTAWTPPTTPPAGFASNLSSLIFTGTAAFVALSNVDGTVVTSGDGVNWLTHSPAGSPALSGAGMNAIGFGFVNGVALYLAVGTGGRIYINGSGDLANWAQILDPNIPPNDLNSIAVLGDGRFYATGALGTLLSSPNASTWNPPFTTGTTSTLRAVTFCVLCTGVRYVAVGDGGAIVTSQDGQSWSLVPLTAFNPPFPGPAPNLQSVTVGGSAGTRFLAVGQSGAVVFSDDGVNWSTTSSGTSNLSKVLYVGSLYLAVGDAGVNAVSR